MTLNDAYVFPAGQVMRGVTLLVNTGDFCAVKTLLSNVFGINGGDRYGYRMDDSNCYCLFSRNPGVGGASPYVWRDDNRLDWL